MARSGLYKSDVKNARDALIAQGKNPSVDAVRVELGNTGSKTTIHKYLKELEEEDGVAGVGGKRASISDALQDLVERLAARLHDEAEERVAAARQEFDAKTSEHGTALVATKLENSKMLARVQEVEAALEQQDAELASTQTELQRESTARQVSEHQAADLKERLAENVAYRRSLEEKHQHAREALDHYRNSVKDQRDADARRHEQQVQQLQAELRQAQQTIAVKQEEATRLNRDGARLITELTHARQSLSTEEERTKRQIRELESLRTMAARHDVLVAQMADRDAQVHDLRQQLAVTGEKRDNLIDQVRGLDQALAQANARADAQEAVATQLKALLAATKEEE
ncbi:MAG: DNA-binding protein [Formivibrio sp.]|nr:DNA-binding protein [Formivibrio sp.]